MADIAIDPTEIRTPAESGAKRPPVGRKTLFIVGGVALGVAAIGGTTAAILSRVTMPTNLSGLAFLPKPEAPRRSEIRIGRLPDMPEIRDGVPAVVGTKPSTDPMSADFGVRSVSSTTVSAASLPAASLPTTFTGANAPRIVSAVSTSGPVPAALAPAAAPLAEPASLPVRAAESKPVAPPAPPPAGDVSFLMFGRASRSSQSNSWAGSDVF